ncbi:hypothetical protein QYE76_065142 [Lolium multiflorum]|uniref:Uncharacterized protein n=1 Tax=Lolium multiflorum TaxID=4521 RepID=A0AAD8SAG7_LOLMU|nr:hypothetical protein QYE76_065142 [Lolium multiflorum]
MVGETSAPVVETVGPALYPRLDRKDYGLWALNMEVAMEATEIWEAVDPGGDDYVKGGAKYTKDRKALTAIYSIVPKDVMQHLVRKKSVKDAWDTIKTLHQGHIREEADEAPPRRKFDIKKVRCHNCGKLGHFKFKVDCRKPPKPKERALIAQQGDDGPMMLMLEECEHMDKEELAPPVPAMEIVTLVEEKVYLHDKRGTKTGGNFWCLDTGASNHMTGDKSLFSE